MLYTYWRRRTYEIGGCSSYIKLHLQDRDDDNWSDLHFRIITSQSATKVVLLALASNLVYPIGSMYAIYGNICHQYTPNVCIYTIHGSYGYLCKSPKFTDSSSEQPITTHYHQWARSMTKAHQVKHVTKSGGHVIAGLQVRACYVMIWGTVWYNTI